MKLVINRSLSLLVLVAVAIACQGCFNKSDITDKISIGKGQRERKLFANGKDIFFIIEVNNERRSQGYRNRKFSKFRSRDAITTKTRQTIDVIRNSTRFKKTLTRIVTTAMDGAALYSTEQTLSGGEKTSNTVTITRGHAEFVRTWPGGSKTEKIQVPRGVMFGIEPDWLLSQKLSEGKTFEATVLDKNKRTLVRERATVKSFRTEKILGTEMGVWEVVVQRENGQPTRMTFTKSGFLVRLQADNMVVRMVTRQEAKKDVARMEVVSKVPTDFPLPAWDNFTRLVYSAEKAEEWRKYLKTTEYVEVNDKDTSIEITLKKTAPRLPQSFFPMKVPDELAPYLAEGEQILSNNKRIKKLARQIRGNQVDVLSTVAMLAGYVHQTVRFQSIGSMNSSPLKTLKEKSGDCSEQADLFASLARSQGIPTRHCQGLLIQSENAVYHTWVEAWIGEAVGEKVSGKWVPVDTTVNRVGLPAGYLLTARGNGDGNPRDQFAWAIRRRGLALRLISATKIHKVGKTGKSTRFTLTPENRKSYVAFDKDWLANLYWGFALTKPIAWKGKINMEVVELTNPEGICSVKVEALRKVFRPSESNLDAVVENLEKSLDGFHQTDARIVPFGKRRPTDSLYVDFTCKQGAARLRCRQYIIPKRGRSYRVSTWAPASKFKDFEAEFNKIIDSIEL